MTARVVLRAARPDDLGAILDVTCRAFGEGARERMFNQLHHDSSHRLEQSRVAEVDGTIASYVRVSDRPIRYGRATLRMGGIGAVATLPDYRGRGLATALLEDAIDFMRSGGYHLSMLFTGISSFYARLGSAPLAEHTFRLPIPTTADGPVPSDHAVRRFDLVRDLAAVERVFDAYNAGRTGPHVRDHRYWLDGHSRVLGVLPALVAERDGEVVAYASVRPRETSLWLYEAGCLPDDFGALRPLASAIVDESRARGATTIEGQLPRSHGLVAALNDPAAAPVEGRLSPHMMLRVIDLDAMLRAASPAIAGRVRHSPRSVGTPRSVGFRVAGAYARLAVDGEMVTIDARSADRVLDVPTDLFFRLFLGERPLSLLTEELAVGGTSLGEDELAFLAALFPPQEPYYWWADHF